MGVSLEKGWIVPSAGEDSALAEGWRGAEDGGAI